MARRNIVELYSRASVSKRVEIILDNYGNAHLQFGFFDSIIIAMKSNRKKWPV